MHVILLSLFGLIVTRMCGYLIFCFQTFKYDILEKFYFNLNKLFVCFFKIFNRLDFESNIMKGMNLPSTMSFCSSKQIQMKDNMCTSTPANLNLIVDNLNFQLRRCLKNYRLKCDEMTKLQEVLFTTRCKLYKVEELNVQTGTMIKESDVN